MFGLSCLQHFCVLSSHGMDSWRPIPLDQVTPDEPLPAALVRLWVVPWDLEMCFGWEVGCSEAGL